MSAARYDITMEQGYTLLRRFTLSLPQPGNTRIPLPLDGLYANFTALGGSDNHITVQADNASVGGITVDTTQGTILLRVPASTTATVATSSVYTLSLRLLSDPTVEAVPVLAGRLLVQRF